MNKRIKLYSSILLLCSITSLALYDYNFDHTKGECAITKILNSIPVEQDEVPFGIALHQDRMMYKQLKAMGAETILFDYSNSNDMVKIIKDGIHESSIYFKRKNK